MIFMLYRISDCFICSSSPFSLIQENIMGIHVRKVFILMLSVPQNAVLTSIEVRDSVFWSHI